MRIILIPNLIPCLIVVPASGLGSDEEYKQHVKCSREIVEKLNFGSQQVKEK